MLLLVDCVAAVAVAIHRRCVVAIAVTVRAGMRNLRRSRREDKNAAAEHSEDGKQNDGRVIELSHVWICP